MRTNKIVLEADTELIDSVCREYAQKLDQRIDTINERTKNHTIQIRELKKKVCQNCSKDV